MKAKKFNKKLSLKKTTISNLSGLEMGVAKGGIYSELPCSGETCFVSVCTCDLACTVGCTIAGTNCYSCSPCNTIDNCTAAPCPA